MPSESRLISGGTNLFWKTLGAISRFFSRDYEAGDTYRYICQKSYEVKLWYVIYRAIHCALMFTLLAISFFHLFIPCPNSMGAVNRFTCLSNKSQVNPSWPFYLTRWGLIINFAQSMMGLILVGTAYHHHQPLEQPLVQLTESGEPFQTLPREHRFFSFSGTYWGVHSVATLLTITIDVVYWAFLHDYKQKVGSAHINYVSEHGVNFLFMIIDWFIVAFPMIIMHGVHLMIVGSAYCFISLIYYRAGGLNMNFSKRHLYPFLDWSKPSTTILYFTGIFSFTFVVMILLIMLDIAKHKIFRPHRPKNLQTSDLSTPGLIKTTISPSREINAKTSKTSNVSLT